uniref:Uncharacterized protein n=1 Tax=Anguilla anguilla TaxID=7936 RepID=A0A0E9V428_ANGAN
MCSMSCSLLHLSLFFVLLYYTTRNGDVMLSCIYTVAGPLRNHMIVCTS